jgi:beta-lactam-binding protein with PASTA domain
MGRGHARAKQSRDGPAVVVPDLRGLTASEAGRVGGQAGVRVVAASGDPQWLHQLLGTVIAQHPDAGAVVTQYADVTVWTSGPGDSGDREPRHPIPPIRENHAALDLGDD